MGKILLQDYSPFQTAWLRYGAAWLGVLLIAIVHMARKKQSGPVIRKVLSRPHILWIFLMGIITFFASPYFQYTGLARSTATENAIIVALEPLFAVVLARVFLGERMAWRQLLAFQFAVVGFCFLSNLRPDKVSESLSLFNMGNILMMLALPAEAMYSIISRRLAEEFSPITIFGFALSLGYFFFSMYLFAIRQESFPNLSLLNSKSMLALLWMGPLGTTITYAYWTYALQSAPVAFVSLTLFVQPIQGALVGYFYLGERLNIWQAAGALLILTALTIQSFPYFRKAKT